MRLGDASWHDGPGWYWTIDEYPEEGSCGAFLTRKEAVDHATDAGYRVTPPICGMFTDFTPPGAICGMIATHHCVSAQNCVNAGPTCLAHKNSCCEVIP